MISNCNRRSLKSSSFCNGAASKATTAQQGSLEMLYRLLQKQAAMLSFNDVFWLLSVFFICLVPFVMLIRRRRDQIAEAGH